MTMKGKAAHLKRLKKLSDATGPANQALRVIAQKIRADAFQSIKAGSVSGKNHVASSPGEAPNNDTSTLANSIIDETFPSQLRAEVRAEAAHATPLEYGTSKMAERPFMRPARDKNKGFAKDVWEKTMGDFVKNSGR